MIPPLPPAWNEAIAQARRMEAVANQPGRSEYALRYTDAGAAPRRALAAALATLAQLETMAGDHGITPEESDARQSRTRALLGALHGTRQGMCS